MIIKLNRRALSRRLDFRGLKISIETDKGELRHWYDSHEKKSGTTKMKYPYGYIRRTEGTDGDHIDCYVGPNERAPKVYIIHQQKAPDFHEYDEDKCMLGFLSTDTAKKAYLDHYNDDRFFGSMTVMSFEDFRNKALKTFDRPAKIAEVTMPKTTSDYLKQACDQGLQRARYDFAKFAAGLGDPAYWQGGSEAAAQQQPPPTEEEAALSLPTGVFQGMNTKLDPMGQKTTSVKVTPDALSQSETLAAIFQANPQAKVEMAAPEAKNTGPGEALSQEDPLAGAPGMGESPTQGQPPQ